MTLLYLQKHETIALGDVQVHVGDAEEVGISSVVYSRLVRRFFWRELCIVTQTYTTCSCCNAEYLYNPCSSSMHYSWNVLPKTSSCCIIWMIPSQTSCTNPCKFVKTVINHRIEHEQVNVHHHYSFGFNAWYPFFFCILCFVASMIF